MSVFAGRAIFPSMFTDSLGNGRGGLSISVYKRITYTDGVTTNGSARLTSATAAFTEDDEGKAINAQNFPSGVTILTYVSATAVDLSLPATASGTGKSFTIAARQRTADLATVYADKFKSANSNPYVADSLGNAFPYLDPGDYDAVTIHGVTPFTVLPDPSEPTVRYSEGTLAARPAANTVAEHTQYLATDENGGTLYISNGVSWRQVAAGVNAQMGSGATLLAPATGVKATDTAIWQNALNALPTAGGWIKAAGPGNVYTVEGLTLSVRDFLGIDLNGSELKLANDDGQGGIGQILKMTDVIKFAWRGNGGRINGNFANAKAGAEGEPLIVYRTTVATQDRTGFSVDINGWDCTESAKAWGQVKIQLYERSSTATTWPILDHVIVRNFKINAHGLRSGFIVRGPARLVMFVDGTARNDGEYGMVAHGVAVIGSTGKPINISAEVQYGHYIDEVIVGNLHCYRTHGAAFTQMVRRRSTFNCTEDELATNPYYDKPPAAVTVDAGTDTFTTVFPTKPPHEQWGHFPLNEDGTTNAAFDWGIGSVVRFTTTGTLPAPLAVGTLYFTRDANAVAGTFKLATRHGGSAINITDAGTGSHSIEWLGYTYIACWKDDDNPVDAQMAYRDIKVRNSSPHGSCQAYSLEESVTHTGTAGKVRWDGFDVDCAMSVDADTVGGDPEFRNGRIRNRSQTVAAPLSSQLHVPGGLVENVHIEPVVTLALKRDFVMRGGGIKTGSLIVGAGGADQKRRVEFDGVLWNTDQTALGRLEVSPPATGGETVLVITNSNRLPVGATQVQQIRINTTGDAVRDAALRVFMGNRAPFALDSSGQALTHAVNWTRTTDFHPAASEAAMLALSNAKQGDVALRTDLSPVGYFVLKNNTPGTLANWQQINSAGAGVDTRVFEASGTWNKPGTATATSLVVVSGIGAGGGGGGGRRGAAGTVRCGGGGGGGAGMGDYNLIAGGLPSSVAVTIGTGGTAGAAATTDDTNGGTGGTGGDVIFGNFYRAKGGAGGSGGTTSSGTGGAGGAGIISGQAGAAASTTGLLGAAAGISGLVPGGGSGGGLSSANAESAGGTGRHSRSTTGTDAAAGTAGGGAGTSGAAILSGSPVPGTSGAGGGSSTTTAGGAGGAGGAYGAGGGGGGASTNGFDSGAGGAGGPGIIVVTTWP